MIRTLCVILLMQSLSGCTYILAERAVKAPNQRNDRIFIPPTPPELTESLKTAQRLQIPVGPPDATLAVWVTPAHRAKVQISIKVLKDKFDFHMTRTPATEPSTAPARQGTIVLLHGIMDHQQLGPYLLYKELLVAAGYRVVQVDLRGHGQSTGPYITFGVDESHDLTQVLDELQKRGLVEGPVGAMGISYGAAVAIQWAAVDPRVKAVVALEPFDNYHDAAHDAAPIALHDVRWLFSDKDIDAAIALSGKIAGFNPDDASPLRAIAKMKTPVLLFHSRADELVSYHQSERLHDAAPDHSKLVLVDGQSHFWMWLQSLEAIEPQSLEWFDRYLTAD